MKMYKNTFSGVFTLTPRAGLTVDLGDNDFVEIDGKMVDIFNKKEKL